MTIAKRGTHRYCGVALMVGAVVTSVGCDRQTNDTSEPPAASTPVVLAPAASTPVVLAPAASSAPTVEAVKVPAGATPCGKLGCLQFESPEDAFRYVLARKPTVLAVGEAHAQKGTESVDSSTKRFTNTFLPFLSGKASDLVVELMAPNPSCKKTTKEVRKKHEVVTEQHADTNQNEYVQMGERAKKLGIVPDLLRPSCDDLSAISKAGKGAVATSLETIARLTTHQVEELLAPDGRKPEDAGKMIVIYGGVLHNDLKPSESRAAWSFGPALSTKVKGSYVALDLFVPEYIGNTEVWKELPWVAHYDKLRHGGKTTLFRLDDRSFALIFPLTES